ncbi:MAG: hypothetical protein HYS36_03970 [Candidatus Rokubacteria bacterium]|nr:hypothetical protein [Candidatus Rokubacteria bacterium]
MAIVATWHGSEQEAYLRLGRLDEATRSGGDGLEMCRGIGLGYGLGLGERLLVERAEQLARDWAAPRGAGAGAQPSPVA